MNQVHQVNRKERSLRIIERANKLNQDIVKGYEYCKQGSQVRVVRDLKYRMYGLHASIYFNLKETKDQPDEFFLIVDENLHTEIEKFEKEWEETKRMLRAKRE